MVSERNRILEISEYLNNIGIDVNIGKNKARGNKGFFKANGKKFRIDISKCLTESEMLSVLVHEFAHFLHYSNDKSLKTLDFIVNSKNNTIEEELLSLTVESISTKDVKPIFQQKKEITDNIKNLVKTIKATNPNFKQTEKNKEYEKQICKLGLKALLKYDKVKCIHGFGIKLYDINNLDSMNIEPVIKNYLLLKSQQRLMKRINSKISRLNKYYNSCTELFARSMEIFILKPTIMQEKAPNLYEIYSTCVIDNKIPMLTKFVNLCI